MSEAPALTLHKLDACWDEKKLYGNTSILSNFWQSDKRLKTDPLAVGFAVARQALAETASKFVEFGWSEIGAMDGKEREAFVTSLTIYAFMLRYTKSCRMDWRRTAEQHETYIRTDGRESECSAPKP